MARQTNLSARAMKGFTLIELLVVVAIIALLISILLPSLGKAKKQAQAVACGSNIKQIALALRYYQDEYDGYLPSSHDPEYNVTGSLWSEAAWNVRKRFLWFYKLVPKYAGDPDVLTCPGDPFKATFDFEARLNDNWDEPMGSDSRVASCGYGLSYLCRHIGDPDVGFPPPAPIAGGLPMNPERWGPRRPANTILLADIGPDSVVEDLPLYGSYDEGGIGRAWRDGGRLLWDDGQRNGYSGETWLTARHLGKIHFMTFDGSVRRVSTIEQLRRPLKMWYRDCWGRIDSKNYICALCNNLAEDTAHYNFSGDQLWWWTGPWPKY
jgi:prepilin-type N-terminal cleavage/methylation domain-containing protein